jgi:hypothetical protein
LYLMTIASTWYDKRVKAAREYELHFAVARRGNRRTVRRHLPKKGVPFLQRLIYRRLKIWIPRRRIKIGSEQEEVAEKAESKIRVEGRSMLYRGKRWWAYPLGRWELTYAKRRRKRKSSKRKRAKD